MSWSSSSSSPSWPRPKSTSARVFEKLVACTRAIARYFFCGAKEAKYSGHRSSVVMNFGGYQTDLIEEVENDMFNENFPDYVDRCLWYCSLFPRDYKFGRHKLVELWIAEGLIKEAEGEGEAPAAAGRVLEEKGYACFRELASKSYIVRAGYNRDHTLYGVNQSKISMYLKYIADDRSTIDLDQRKFTDDISDMTLYSCLTRFDPNKVEALQKCKALRTLVLIRCDEYGDPVRQIPPDLFPSLKSLRTLDLSNTNISVLPDSVVYLKSLRYLDLSDTRMGHLSEGLCCVVSLQTLKLRGCSSLHALPTRMMELINLRHLDFDIIRQLWCMPEQIGKLSNLQTLTGFIVGMNEDAYGMENGCGIEELRQMNNIAGPFHISGLEKVSSADEAKRAELKNKKYVTILVLEWTRFSSTDSKSDQEGILECLVPHTSLQQLTLRSYPGSVFPSWISNPSFSNISHITLEDCANCSFLPCLGKLPLLKFLRIVHLDEVRKISRLFCRDDDGDGGKKNKCGLFCKDDDGDGGKKNKCGFPKLETLMLMYMPMLEEWNGVEDGDFPCLTYLEVSDCPKLAGLPVVSHLYSLKEMEVSSCSELQSLPPGRFPASLQYVTIMYCPKLEKWILKGGKYLRKISHVPVKNIGDHTLFSKQRKKQMKEEEALSYLDEQIYDLMELVELYRR